MEESLLKERFLLAKSIAKKVSDFLLANEKMRFEAIAKADNDYVTSADKLAEDLIENEIRSSFPDDSFYGEENGKIGSDQNRRWIIDPIDGTVDFMTGFPNYTVSIAFEDEDGLAFGVVAIPRQNELFSAFRSEGAFLNGKAIHTDEGSPLKKHLAILVPPHRHHELLDCYISKMRRFYDLVSDVRSVGSAACSLCYVACGRVAMYYEIGLKIYDCAAGIVIVKEAGGQVTLLSDDEEWIEIASSTSSSHERMIGIIND